MAQQALGAGTDVPRKRALFGLLDADGWAWASVKAFVWLVIIILMLGYIPDRAYYLTVGRTVDLGVLVWSPINLCPRQRDAAVSGAASARSSPWHAVADRAGAARSRGPTARVIQVGHQDPVHRRLGRHDRPVDRLRRPDGRRPATSTSGPRARRCPSRAPTPASSPWPGSIYVIGGRDADRRPDDDGLRPHPRSARPASSASGTPADGAWSCPRHAAGAAGGRRARRAAAHRRRGRRRPGRDDLEERARRRRAPWARGPPRPPLSRRRPTRRPSVVGDFVWLCGGQRRERPGGRRPARRHSDRGGRRGCPRTRTRARSSAGTSTTPSNLPAPATTPPAGAPTARSTWPAATTAAAPRPSCTGRSRPRPATCPSGSTSTSATCRPGIGAARRVVTGPERGPRRRVRRADGAVGHEPPREHRARRARSSSSAWSARRCPGLKIEGEIGQQLGYLNAAGAGTVNFIILLLIGWAFAHKEQARAIIAARPPPTLTGDRRAGVSRAGRPRPARACPRRTGRPARSQASIPPATLTTSVRPERVQEAGHGRRPAAQVADDASAAGPSAARRPVPRTSRSGRGRRPARGPRRTRSARGRRGGAAGPGPRAAGAPPRRRRSSGSRRWLIGRAPARIGGPSGRRRAVSGEVASRASIDGEQRPSRHRVARRRRPIDPAERLDAADPARPRGCGATPAGLPRTPWTSAAATLIRPWIRARSARSSVPIQAGSSSSCASK